MLSPFESLPVEVYDIIASHFELPEYHHVRLTSHRLRALSFKTYAKRFFPVLTTTLGSASLDRLVNISDDEYTSTAVTVLDIRLLNHRDYKTLTKISRVGIFPPPKRFPKVSGVRSEQIPKEATLYDDLCRDQDARCIVDRLTHALKRFPNLQSIRYRAFHTEPWGWQATVMPDKDQWFRSKCFQAVVAAIIKSGVRLKELSMAKGRRLTTLSKCANVPYPALDIPLTSLSAMQHNLSELQTLILSAVSAHNRDARVPGWENGLSHLISATPSVQTLALCLDRNNHISHYSAAIVRSLARSCQLQQLSTFFLVNSSLMEEDLSVFLTAHAESLREVVLGEIQLLGGTWKSIWASMKGMPLLECLRLASLKGTESPITFRRQSRRRANITLDTQKSGRTMVELLTDLIADHDMSDDRFF